MGDGPGVLGLKTKPRPFRKGKFRYGATYAAVMKSTTHGSPDKSAGMVGWSWMPLKQRKAITLYILHLAGIKGKAAQRTAQRAARPASHKAMARPNSLSRPGIPDRWRKRITRLLQRLRSPSVKERIGAASRLNELSAAGSLRALSEDLRDWKGFPPSVVPALVKALRDPESMVRSEAAHALGKIGPKSLPHC